MFIKPINAAQRPPNDTPHCYGRHIIPFAFAGVYLKWDRFYWIQLYLSVGYRHVISTPPRFMMSVKPIQARVVSFRKKSKFLFGRTGHRKWTQKAADDIGSYHQTEARARDRLRPDTLRHCFPLCKGCG